MSTFSGINLSSRALAAAQRGMEVTGQNIANVNTPGYTRQRVEQVQALAGTSGTWSQQNVAGNGVEITGISRVSDALTDAAARQDAATSAEQRATSRVWNDVEASLGEPGTAGLTQQLNDMHKAWGDLANANGSEAAVAARANVVARSQAVADTLNGLQAQLAGQWDGQVAQVRALADEAGSAAAEIAALNSSILQATSTGASPNELLDRREAVITRLAELTGARVVQREHGMVDVYVGNTAVVRGTAADRVQVAAQPSLTDVRGGARLTITVGGVPALPAGGTMRSALDAVNTTLPQVSEQFDDVATSITAAVNTVYGAGGAGAFFTTSRASADSPLRVQVAVDAAGVQDSSAGTVDRSVAKGISELMTAPDGPPALWRGTVVDLAARSQAAELRADLAAQTSLRSTLARESVSGVNIDEEMTNLVAYQHAYSAAARVLTTIDQALDTLINRTGVVGR